MSLHIPKMSDTPAITIPGLAANFEELDSHLEELDSHLADLTNPHAVTAAQIPYTSTVVGFDPALVSAGLDVLAGGRVVDHNLDVTNPENGYYVRWENGLQVCWSVVMLEYQSDTMLRCVSWVPAASFVEFPFVAHMPNTLSNFTNVPSSARQHFAGAFINFGGGNTYSLDIYAAQGTFSSDHYMSTCVIVIGRWK